MWQGSFVLLRVRALTGGGGGERGEEMYYGREKNKR